MVNQAAIEEARICKMEHSLTPFTKIISKWIKDLNMRPKTIKLLKDTGSNILDINLSNVFMDMFPQAREAQAKINY